MKNERKKEEVREFCRQLKLRAIGDGFESAVEGADDYMSYLHGLLAAQVKESDDRAIQRRTVCPFPVQEVP